MHLPFSHVSSDVFLWQEWTEGEQERYACYFMDMPLMTVIGWPKNKGIIENTSWKTVWWALVYWGDMWQRTCAAACEICEALILLLRNYVTNTNTHTHTHIWICVTRTHMHIPDWFLNLMMVEFWFKLVAHLCLMVYRPFYSCVSKMCIHTCNFLWYH